MPCQIDVAPIITYPAWWASATTVQINVVGTALSPWAREDVEFTAEGLSLSTPTGGVFYPWGVITSIGKAS